MAITPSPKKLLLLLGADNVRHSLTHATGQVQLDKDFLLQYILIQIRISLLAVISVPVLHSLTLSVFNSSAIAVSIIFHSSRNFWKKRFFQTRIFLLRLDAVKSREMKCSGNCITSLLSSVHF